MIRISEAVHGLIKARPYLEFALQQGLINYSALARQIRPEVEARCLKPVTTSAVVMALKRLEPLLVSQFQATSVQGKLTDMIVRSGLVELTYANSPTLAQTVHKLLDTYHGVPDNIMTYTQGNFETSLVVSQSITTVIKQNLKPEKLVKEIGNLASIAIKLDKTITTNPGSYYEVLKVLAWENINLIEIFSTYRELVILFNSQDIDEAFRVLKKYFM